MIEENNAHKTILESKFFDEFSPKFPSPLFRKTWLCVRSTWIHERLEEVLNGHGSNKFVRHIFDESIVFGFVFYNKLRCEAFRKLGL